jgi:rubrerythrin
MQAILLVNLPSTSLSWFEPQHMTNTHQFRLSRLNIFLFDFRQAQRFARYILRKKLHSVKDPQAVAKLIHLAFNTSLIVAYSRPFHKSNDGLNAKVSLRDAVNGFLDAHEQILHHKIINLRDQTFAHSDSASHEIEGFNYDGTTVQFYKVAFEALTREETRLLGTMIGKWINHLEEQRAQLKASCQSHSLGITL